LITLPDKSTTKDCFKINLGSSFVLISIPNDNLLLMTSNAISSIYPESPGVPICISCMTCLSAPNSSSFTFVINTLIKLQPCSRPSL